MDARESFLYLHHATHFTGKAQWSLEEPMLEHYRTVLPEPPQAHAVTSLTATAPMLT